VSIKIGTAPAEWFTGPEVVRQALVAIDWATSAALCHHCAFDGAILAWHYGVKPKLWMDTMSMARPKHKATTGVSLRALLNFYHLRPKGTYVDDAKGKRLADFTPLELEAYGAYCIDDNEGTYDLFNKLKIDFPVSELQIIDQTIRMYTEPRIELNRSRLEKHLRRIKYQKELLLEGLIQSLGLFNKEELRKTLSSNGKFAQVLESYGVEPPVKPSPTTPENEIYAFAKTDEGFLALLEHPEPMVQALANARLGVKSTLEETRTARLIGVSKRGLLPIMLGYYNAHTGRYGGGDKLNLQNLPVRKDNTIRRCLEAPEGYKILTCDSAQIEARLLAYAAGQDNIVKAFREGRDIYSEFASKIYEKKITRDDEIERFVGKTSVLGLGYGMGKDKFIRTLSIQSGGKITTNQYEAERIVRIYRDTNHLIKDLWMHGDAALLEVISGAAGSFCKGLITYDATGFLLPSGMKLSYSSLQSIGTGEWGQEELGYLSTPAAHRKYARARIVSEKPPKETWTSIYGGKLIENIIQALARIVVFEQMQIIGRYYPVLFQVHDENVAMIPDGQVTQAKELITRIMSTSPSWAPNLPLACEIGVGQNFGDAK